MVMVLFASVAAVPVQPISNLTHRSSHNPPMSQAPQSLHPVAPLLNQSRHLLTQISPSSIPVSSGKTPTQSKKVEEFAKKLRTDLQTQEQVLNVFIKTIKDRHTNTQSKLNSVKVILKGLKDEINNATKYANQYQSQDNDLTKQSALLTAEYMKSVKMYEDEKQNIAFERQFIEQIIKYIQLRKC